jgi:hypothetical protein
VGVLEVAIESAIKDVLLEAFLPLLAITGTIAHICCQQLCFYKCQEDGNERNCRELLPGLALTVKTRLFAVQTCIEILVFLRSVTHAQIEAAVEP